jgi:hypothetical protein
MMDQETEAPVDDLEAMVEDEDDLGDGSLPTRFQCPYTVFTVTDGSRRCC